jgi:photosystem II stability/assembly factor-like uncharacterized protein
MRNPLLRLTPIFLLLLTTLAGCAGLPVTLAAPTPFPTTQAPAPATQPPAVATAAPELPAFTGSYPGGSGLTAGTPLTVNQVAFFDATTGWASGQVDGEPYDRVFASADGGQTWNDRTPPDAFAAVPQDSAGLIAHFASPTHAWIVYSHEMYLEGAAEPLVWYTGDGGTTWTPSQPLSLADLPQEHFYPSDLGFLPNGQTGWLLAHLGFGMNHDYVAVFQTDDGGQTWRRTLDPFSFGEAQGCQKTGLAFSDPNTGWLTGSCAGLASELLFYATYDAGQTWFAALPDVPPGQPADLYHPADRPTGCGLTQVNYADPRALVLTLSCADYDQDGALSAWLLTGRSAGSSWTANPLPLPYAGFSFAGPARVWMLATAGDTPNAGSVLYFSEDGGATWAWVSEVPFQGTPVFVDEQRGWVSGAQAERRLFARTLDGGRTWEPLAPVVAAKGE